MLCFTKSFGYWIVMSLVSINLIGFFWAGVAGFQKSTMLDQIDAESPKGLPLGKILTGGKQRVQGLSFGFMFIFGIIIMSYLYGIFKVWNEGMAFVAFMLMVQRIPDLIYEGAPPSISQTVWTIAGNIIWFGMFFVIWRLVC